MVASFSGHAHKGTSSALYKVASEHLTAKSQYSLAAPYLVIGSDKALQWVALCPIQDTSIQQIAAILLQHVETYGL